MASVKIPGTPWFVYRVTCTANGLEYYGLTSNPIERRHHHRYTKSGAPKVLEMREKHGAETLSFEVIAWFPTKAEAAAHEKEKIAECNSIWPNGLNLVGNGRGCLLPNMSAERHDYVTKRSQAFWSDPRNKVRHQAAMAASPKAQDAQKRNGNRITEWGRIPENAETRRLALIGHRVSEETRRKIGDSKRGKKFGAVARANMSAAHVGKKHTAETRARMSVSQSRRATQKSLGK